MTPKIIFDASVLVTGNTAGTLHKTGLYRVSYEILKELEKSERFELYLYDVFHRERELVKYVQKEFKKCNRIRIHSKWYIILLFPLGNAADFFKRLQQHSKSCIISGIARFLKNSILLFEKGARKIDRIFFVKNNLNTAFSNCNVYFSTYFPIPAQVLAHPHIKKIYTLHDLIPLIHPEYFSSPFNTKLVKEVVDSINNNDKVICVSYSTKKDFLSFRPDFNSERVYIAHLAAADCFHQKTDLIKINAIRDKFNMHENQKYFLSVCTFEPRKNLKTLISAFSNFLQQEEKNDFALVLTGAPYWDKDPLLEEIRIINQTHGNKVIITGFVNDDELSILYNGAYTFIYPSLYEGFGLPPLEAMQCGVPVICSNTSSLPEVVGDCGLMFDPTNELELLDAIILLSRDEKLHDSLSKKSLLQAARFNWSKTSATVLSIFDN